MKPVLKYPGAKWKIADWIINCMPKHHTYVEPYFGSGAILFKKAPSPIETVNDLDINIVNLFKIVRENSEELARVISATPYSRFEYDNTFKTLTPDDELERARRFLIQCWQGQGFRTNGCKVGWKSDVQGREKAYALSNWYQLPEWIMAATDRLKMVQIENRPAIDVIKRFRYQNVLIYADPPCLLGTRAAKQYKHEMNEQDHLILLETLLQHPGPVIISGYQSGMYDTVLKDWHKQSITAQAEHGKIRTENIWMNFRSEYEQLSMFFDITLDITA